MSSPSSTLVIYVLIACATVIASLGPVQPLRAQQLLNARSAVQPSEGVFAVRQFARYTHFEDDPNAPPTPPTPLGSDATVDQYQLETLIAYGITRDLTAMLHVPIVHRDFDDPPPLSPASPDASLNDDFGIQDITLMAQYRFWKLDTGPIDTQRAVAFVGLEIPTFDGIFSSDSFDPFIGVAYTAIFGRHGFGGGLQWKFNGGDRPRPTLFGDTEDDAGRLDLSYAYRIDPEQYTGDTTSASFLTLELLNRYETNGDTEILIAPGFLFEAITWAAGLSVQLPLHQDLSNRPEQTVSVVAEFRVLF